MLAILRMSVEDCLTEYENLVGHVLGHPRLVNQSRGLGVSFARNKYSTTSVEIAIQEVIRRRGEGVYHQEDEMPFGTANGACKA